MSQSPSQPPPLQPSIDTAGSSQPAAPQSPARIEALDSLRGLCVLLVVLCQIPRWHPIFELELIRNGYLAVPLLFVLSGFVICRAHFPAAGRVSGSLSGRIASTDDLLRFQFLRAGRLYPVHILFLLVFVALETAKDIAQTRFGITRPGMIPFGANTIEAFVQQLLLIQAIGPTGTAYTFNSPAWAVSVAFYVYLLFALVTLCLPRAAPAAYAVLGGLAFTLLATGATLASPLLLGGCCGFFLGCALARAAPVSASRVATVPGGLGMLALTLTAAYLACKPDRRYDLAIYPLGVLLVYTLAHLRDGALKSLLGVKPLLWLGTVSYSIYMSHYAITWVASQVFRVVLKRPEHTINRTPVAMLPLHEALLGAAAVLAAVLLVSAMVYRRIERPLAEKSRRFAALTLG